MLSFSKVVTFVAVAFGTLCQAAPLIPRDVSIRTPASGPVQLRGLLTDLKTQLTIAVEPISKGVQFTPMLILLTSGQITLPTTLLRRLLSSLS